MDIIVLLLSNQVYLTRAVQNIQKLSEPPATATATASLKNVSSQLPRTLVDFVILRGANGSKNMIFKNWLDTPQKWKHMTQLSTQPFWKVFREVFGLRS